MISRVWALALNTYREAVRQKILYTLVFFAVILILFSLVLGQLSLGADVKIVKDAGLASILFFGALISIFMGIGLVFKEIDRRTIFTILSKPVSRTEFILGKFFGLAMTIGLEVLFMTVLLSAMLAFYGEPVVDIGIVKAVVLIYAELCVLIGVTLVFSSYSSSFMSGLFCMSFLVLGHLTDDFAGLFYDKSKALLAETDGIAAVGPWIMHALIYVLKAFSLDHFSIQSLVVHGVPVGWTWIFQSLAYGVAWVFLLLVVAVFLFKRKDFQ